MVFVYLGIAVVVIFLFLVGYYNRKSIFKMPKRAEKKKVVKEQSKEEEKTEKKISYNDFSDPVVKEYSDIEQVLTPEDDLPKNTNIDDVDDIDYQQSMYERRSEYFDNQEDEDESEGPDGSFRDIMQQRISIGSHSLSNRKPTIHGDDYDEMISEYDLGQENTSFAKRFAELPPDMKAIMLSDILNKKY